MSRGWRLRAPLLHADCPRQRDPPSSGRLGLRREHEDAVLFPRRRREIGTETRRCLGRAENQIAVARQSSRQARQHRALGDLVEIEERVAPASPRRAAPRPARFAPRRRPRALPLAWRATTSRPGSCSTQRDTSPRTTAESSTTMTRIGLRGRGRSPGGNGMAAPAGLCASKVMDVYRSPTS